MTLKEFVAKFKSPFLWINLVCMAVVAALCVFGVTLWLRYYTHHGEEVAVPDVTTLSENEAVRQLEKLGLIPLIADSGYSKHFPAGVILEQSIASGSKVKAGRNIFLTINSSNSPTVAMPDIADNSSVRQATSKLTAMGFVVSPPNYIAGEAEWVYDVLVGGRSVVAGQRVPSGAVVTLVVGDGSDVLDELIDSLSDYSGGYTDVPATSDEVEPSF